MIRSDHCSDEMKERIEGEYPMKKWIGRMAVLLAFVLTLSGSTLAAFGKIPSATKEFYVNDYAGVFSDTWKEELCKAGEQLYEDTTAQLVVLTVDPPMGKTSVIMQWKPVANGELVQRRKIMVS